MLALPYYSVSLSPKAEFASVLLPGLSMSCRSVCQCLIALLYLSYTVFASVELQCHFMSYSNACERPNEVSLYALEQWLPVSYFSVSQCPTALFSIVLLQFLSVPYSSVCQCHIAVSRYVLQL